MAEKDYLIALQRCQLIADIYYESVDLIENQLLFNIRYDIEHDGTTDYARNYALSLKGHAEIILETIKMQNK